MNNLKLLQIGDRSFHLGSQTIFEDYKVNSRSDTEQLLYSPTMYASDAQWINKARDFSISGTHVSTSSYDSEGVLQELGYWIGKPTVLIAYTMPHISQNQGYSCGCGCGTSDSCFCDIVFLQAYGVLEAVNKTTDDPYLPMEVSLSVKILGFWKELDTYSFKWADSVLTTLDKQKYQDDGINYLPIANDCGGESYYNKLPTAAQLLNCSGCGGFIFVDWEHDKMYYEEEFWDEQYNDECYGRGGGYSKVFLDTPNKRIRIPVNRTGWNAPPISIYSFNNLPSEGTITLGVVKRNGMSTEQVDSTIDLEVLDTLLADNGYVGITEDDILYVGSINRYVSGDTFKPSFIKRAGVVLSIHPVWSYKDWYPGMVSPTNPEIFYGYVGNGDFSNTRFSFVQHYRRI